MITVTDRDSFLGGALGSFSHGGELSTFSLDISYTVTNAGKNESKASPQELYMDYLGIFISKQLTKKSKPWQGGGGQFASGSMGIPKDIFKKVGGVVSTFRGQVLKE